MSVTAPATRKRRYHITELAIAAALAGLVVAFYLLSAYWPFRYREVHPLLEKTFRSRVDVKHYHRTYFPHPGYVAEDITFYRHGDTQIPPLATLKRMTVVGRWTNLIFHPHKLYEIRLDGLRVQIPPPGTQARGKDFDQGVIDSSQQEIEIETIIADATTLDFLRHGQPPLRFEMPKLKINNVRQNHPLDFAARIGIPEPRGTVIAHGSVGPFRTSDYGSTPLSGNFSLIDADLSSLAGIAGHAGGGGNYRGTFSRMEVNGNVAIPDFRAGSAHKVALNSEYHVTVNGTNGDVEINNAQVRTGGSLITASGTVAGSPKKVVIAIATKDSHLEELLNIVQERTPSVAGNVSFQAAVNLAEGQGRFLQRLALKGNVSISQAHFVSPQTQQDLDSFSARVRKDPPGSSATDTDHVRAEAQTQTTFHDGMAYFPDVQVSFPGANAHLGGTFNLLNTQIHLTGKVALDRDISHAATGWKSWMLKPLAPLFRHKDAGAVVSIAVTGTARKPQVGQDILHDK